MYYKITNTECEVYKKLHDMRTQELIWEDENVKLIEEKTGLEWDRFLGRNGQQSFTRVSTFHGFEFKNPEKVDLEIWERHKKHDCIFIPKKRTKMGREMAKFLLNGLKGHWFCIVYDILGLEHPSGKFSFPFVAIREKTILLMIDDILTNENIIEITLTEFNKILK